MKKAKALFASATLAVMLYGCSANNDNVKNVILIIGDGMGLNQVCTVAADSANNFSRAQYTGFSRTCSADHKVTDSAAGGTAIACGIKTRNGMLGLTPDTTTAVPSILAYARDNGLATGIVVSCKIDHATPASFYAHQPNRGMSAEIVEDYLKAGIDVIAGGGQNLIANKDTLQQLGLTYCSNIDEMAAAKGTGICALLTPEAMQPAPMRGDTIPMAVKEALRLLTETNKGFFLMIEGSQIDWAGHGNDGDYLVAEMQDINKVIGICMDYADNNPGTLVVITADHETGGLALKGEEMNPTFTTGSHTGVNVPIFAYGTGAKNFTGIMENTSIKNKILKLLRIIK